MGCVSHEHEQLYGECGSRNVNPMVLCHTGVGVPDNAPVIGILADRYIAPVHLLSACQLMAGVSMGMCWWLGYSSPMPDKVMFTVMYTLSSAFFMPTVALSNTIAFRVMRSRGIDTVKGFPKNQGVGHDRIYLCHGVCQFRIIG